MRDFDWFDELYAVVKEDGSFAGVPCTSLEEARELSAQHEGSKIFLMQYDNENFCDYDDEPANIDDDFGFDPYMGEYTYDC
jgi:hypothetical protein